MRMKSQFYLVVSHHWFFSSLLPALNPHPLLSKQHQDLDSDTRKHFQAFLMHTSHPQAGWENRCQQSTTHSAGKEPDRIPNEQQAAYQSFTTARFTWGLQYNVLHIAVCGPQRRVGLQVHTQVWGTLHFCWVALPLWATTVSYTTERVFS